MTSSTSPVLASLSICDQLKTLADEHAALKAEGRHAAARAVKEQALCLLEAAIPDDPTEQDDIGEGPGEDHEPPSYRTEIVYCRETRDYAMYVDGELVGFARNQHEAEQTLNALISELIT